MCGIVGAFGPGARRLAENLPRALKAIAHRGPDDSGTFVSTTGSLVLGHVRLAIQDTSKSAAQPMISSPNPRNAGGILAYNGEIYNHGELRRRFLQDFSFKTHGDTETLLLGLDQMGAEFFQHVEGMYAGAYFRPDKNSLLLFRDPLAIKPLYYRVAFDSTVTFSSEIKGLFALDPSTPRTCNFDSLQSYFEFENYPSDKTLFAEISLLPQGSTLNLQHADGAPVDLKPLLISAFRRNTEGFSSSDTVESLREEIRESVSKHLLSDHPVGVYLSGGIDSALVTALAASQRADIAAFTGFFEGESDPHYDERPLARAVAKRYSVEHQEVPIRADDFSQNFDALIHSLEEPRMGMGSFSQFVVAKHAARHRRVILAGHGGDELFGGYPLFRLFFALDPDTRPKDRIATLINMRRKEWPWFFYGLGKRISTGRLQFAPSLGNTLLSGQTARDPFGIFSSKKVEKPLAELFRYYREVYLPGLLLVEDKVSMSHSLETRTPLWSQAIVNFSMNITPGFKLRGGELKGLLKEAARPLLPPELLSAPKRGFPTPLRNWFRETLHDELKERLLGQNAISSIFSDKDVLQLLDNHKSRKLPFALDERRAHRIWMLLCLESWSRQFNVDLRPA